jgi:hypothetical protein
MDQYSLVVAALPILASLGAALYHYLLGLLPAARQAQAQSIVAQVVPAVEQLYKAIPGSGADKKARALQLAQSILKQAHISVSPEQLDVLIEGAVRSLAQSA